MSSGDTPRDPTHGIKPDATSPEQQTAPPPARTRTDSVLAQEWLAWRKFFTSPLGLAVLFLIAIAGVLLVYPSLPTRIYFVFKPPPAQLFVDSPEVYTRERLINDRLQESIWLNKQLEAIDKAESFIRAVDTTRTEFSIAAEPPGQEAAADAGAGDQSPPERSEPAGPGDADGQVRNLFLTFDQQFELNSYYRSLVRQKILENSLDDRHDLLGNSLYVLKFDTTMVSVPAVGQRGRVTIRVVPPPPLDNLDFTQSDLSSVFDVLKNDNITHESVTRFFVNWIDVTAYVLNTLMAERFNRLLRGDNIQLMDEFEDYMARFEIGPPDAGLTLAERTRRVRFLVGTERKITTAFIARKVLAEYYRSGEDRIVIPELLTDSETPTAIVGGEIDGILQFILLPPKEDQPFSPPAIDVRRKFFSAYVIHNDCLTGLTIRDVADIIGISAYKVRNISVPFYSLKDSNYTLFATEANMDAGLKDWILDTSSRQEVDLASDIFQKYSFDAALNDILVYQKQVIVEADAPRTVVDDRLLANMDRLEACLKTHGSETIYGIYAGTGLVNYIQSIKKFSTYGYSVLPRESPIAIMRDIATVNRFVQDTGATRVSGLFETNRRGVDLRQSLTTFGDLQITSADRMQDTGVEEWEPIVGWIIDPAANQVSSGFDYVTTSESVLAIISAPAWWTEVKLSVKVELLGRWGSYDDPAHVTTKEFAVQLPNQPDSIDTLLIEDTRRGPVISDVECTAVLSRSAAGEKESVDSSVHVIIHGRHLWRNTVVTLGGLKADAIEVLPNMKGILARFDETGLENDRISGVLRVWTSNGVAEPPLYRIVTIEPDDQSCSLESGGTDPLPLDTVTTDTVPADTVALPAAN